MNSKGPMRPATGSTLLLLVIAILMLGSTRTAHGQTCCWRGFKAEISVPAGVSQKIVRDAWYSVFSSRQYGGGPPIQDCEPPIRVDVGAPQVQREYMFRGTLTRSGGSFSEDWALHVDLIDLHRGDVVRSGDAAWQCKSSTAGYCDEILYNQVRALAQTFHPLDAVLHGHERTPETATVQPERDPIEAKERMTVYIRDIEDSEKRPSQPWQCILAKADKGKILNGVPQAESYRRFEVGDGSIELSYKAPDDCKRQTETITIYNSCNNDPRRVVNFIPEKEIAAGSFEIRCEPETIWTGTITYTRGFNKTNKEQGPNNSTVKMQEIVTENAEFEVHGWPFSHAYEGSVGSDLYYEGDENSVTGSYSGTYKKITTTQSPEGTSTITDSAFCQAVIRDSGYLVINNVEMRAFLEVGVSFVGDQPCHGQSVYSGDRGSFTMDFDWDQHKTFAGLGYLEWTIPNKNPQTVSGSYSLPGWGITWTWNLELSGR